LIAKEEQKTHLKNPPSLANRLAEEQLREQVSAKDRRGTLMAILPTLVLDTAEEKQKEKVAPKERRGQSSATRILPEPAERAIVMPALRRAAFLRIDRRRRSRMKRNGRGI
jgi:hypothetical protein